MELWALLIPTPSFGVQRTQVCLWHTVPAQECLLGGVGPTEPQEEMQLQSWSQAVAGISESQFPKVRPPMQGCHVN